MVKVAWICDGAAIDGDQRTDSTNPPRATGLLIS
jgi:hypothetical protein